MELAHARDDTVWCLTLLPVCQMPPLIFGQLYLLCIMHLISHPDEKALFPVGLGADVDVPSSATH